MDIKEICVQEIALEGLDGITMPALFLRLNNREPALPYKISDKLGEFLWKFILQYPHVQVLQIPEPRNEPQIFDRFAIDSGHQVPLASAPDELDTVVEVYSTRAVEDADCGIRGSCSNYHKRVNIKDMISKHSLDLNASFERYGKQRIIVVASQELREQQLLSGNLTALVLADLSPVCYCVLEKVARSRWQGVIMSRLNKMEFPHKAFQAVVQKLYNVGLVSKMHHTYRPSENNSRVRSQVLVTLKKFEREGMSFSSKLFKRFLCELQEAPNQTMNLGKLKEKLDAGTKVFKTAYRSLKDSGEIDITNVDPKKYSRSVYQMNVSLIDKPSGTGMEEDDDDDIQSGKSDFICGPLVLERPYLYQAYNLIVQNENKGVSQAELQRFMTGFGKLEARYIMKMLVRMELVRTVLIDRGRQRIQMYYPKNVSNKCSRSKEFIVEKKKMQQLVLSTKYDKTNGSSDNTETSTKVTSVNDDDGSNPRTEHPTPSRNEEKSTMPTPDVDDLKKWDANLTARSIRRHNIILEHVNKEKTVTGYRTLQKLIQAVEKKDGHKTVIDSHSVVRLVHMMSVNGVLRHTDISISHGDVTENLNFVSSLDCPDTVLESAVDQAKFKLALKEQNRIVKINKKATDKERRESRKKNDEIRLATIQSIAPSNTLTSRCFQPKYIRLRSLHQFFWYLAYGHPKATQGSSEIIDSDTPTVYDKNLSWKRYLPPAPIHMIKGLPWLQVGELALILPLSVFCQFHKVPVVSEELKSFLLDEDKCHTLVSHLPASVKCLLLDKRKYMFSLSACIDQLFFMGLITMRRSESAHRPIMPKEKMILYVHKNTRIVDTRSSINKYMKVEDKEYDKFHYVFNDYQDVESFWYQLQAVCMQTKLGLRDKSGDDSPCDNSHLSDNMVKRFVKASFEHPSDPIDDGTVPGDGRGAGGIDSSMFSFLIKNWNSPQTIKVNYHDRINNELVPFQRSNLDATEQFGVVKKPKRSRSSRKIDTDADCNPPSPKRSKSVVAVEASSNAGIRSTNKLKRTALNNTDLPTSSKQQGSDEPVIVIESNVGRNERVKGGRGLKRKLKDPLAQELQTFSNMGIPKRRKRQKQEPMGFIQQGRQRIKYIDKVDLKAIKSRNGRIRAVFSKDEDSLYLLCHVTTSLLIQLYWKKPFQPRKQIIPWSIVRDIACRYLPESHDKTSYSVGRRTHVIMKNPETRICHDISVADIKSDVQFLKKFCPANLDLETENTRVHEVYRNLVDQLKKRFKTQPGLFCEELPDSNEQLLERYTPQTILCKNEDIVSRRSHFDDVIHDPADIKKSIAENMIYIALAMSDSEFSIYQAYRAFQEYTEAVVSDVFTRMRLSGFICRSKIAQRKVPCAMRRYRLAQSHTRSLQASVPRSLLDKVSQALETATDIEIKTTSSVESIFLTSYFWTKKILDISIEIPEQVVLPETSNTSAFENQFRSMLQGAQEDLLNKLKDLQSKDYEGGPVPPDSLMAAVGTILKENFDEDPKRGDGDGISSDAADTKLKIAELIRLYYRHPSYTNWLILIKPTKRTESKFASLNFSSTSDCIVLTPCKISVHNVADMAAKFCHNFLSQIPKLRELLFSKHVRVDDSGAKWEGIQKEKIDTQSFVMQAIFDAVDGSSYKGLTKFELLCSVSFDQATTTSALDKLYKKNIVFAVGVKEERIVSYRNVTHWTAKGFKFKDSTLNFQSEIQYERELFQMGNGNQANRKDTPSEDLPEGERIQGRYEELKFICRPWHNMYGGICFSAAKSLLTSVFMKVYSSPGITEEAICASFIYQPVCVLELLGILRDTDCIHERSIEYPAVKRLFGVSRPAKTVVYYEACDDGLIILSQWVAIANKLISMPSTEGNNT